VAYFNVLCRYLRHLRGETLENQENNSVMIVGNPIAIRTGYLPNKSET
jgi:hypothetical protein